VKNVATMTTKIGSPTFTIIDPLEGEGAGVVTPVVPVGAFEGILVGAFEVVLEGIVMVEFAETSVKQH
jgi:hypothetical protein